jgi:predicted nucleic acid-binding Zn ribbon protein
VWATNHREPRLLDDLLKEFARRHTLMPRMKYRRLARAWADAVGPDDAAISRVAGFDKGKLSVEVASPALMQSLRGFRYREILRCVRQNDGARDVRRIQFKLVGPFTEPEKT